MKTSISLLIAMFLLSGFNLTAQKFSLPLEGFSMKKAAYLTMEDGTIFEGTLNGLKRTKGLIKTVKMKDEKGEKIKIDPSKINFMYLAPSDLAKFGTALDQAYDINKWDKEANSTIDSKLMKEGYVYFEKVLTQVKKKKKDLMLQVINPSFSSKIKVYHDPFAGETMSVGIGNFTLAGGLDKSYYIKKEGEDTAYRLLKKNYKEEFEAIFGDCEAFMTKYADKISWSKFETHVYEYTQMMAEK